jgi:hypothetical protein
MYFTNNKSFSGCKAVSKMIKGYGFFEDCKFSKRWANVFFN